MENVLGMAAGVMRGILKELMAAFGEAGYRTRCRKLNAALYRVPQSRARLFWVGIRDDLDSCVAEVIRVVRGT